MATARVFLRFLAPAAVVGLAGCSGLPPNAPLVSGASPAFTNNVNAEPQSPNSLPPGAEGLQSSGPNSVAPNYLGATFRAF